MPSAGLCDQAARQMTLQGQVDLASVSGSRLTPQCDVFSSAESYKKKKYYMHVNKSGIDWLKNCKLSGGLGYHLQNYKDVPVICV